MISFYLSDILKLFIYAAERRILFFTSFRSFALINNFISLDHFSEALHPWYFRLVRVCNFNGILELLYGRSSGKAASLCRKREDVLGADFRSASLWPEAANFHPFERWHSAPHVDFANI